jgi:hypothetical protein
MKDAIQASFFVSSTLHPDLSVGGAGGRDSGRGSRRLAWSDLSERSKETVHSHGNDATSRNAGLAKMKSIVDGLLDPRVRVIAPSGTSETRFSSSIQSSRLEAQGDGRMSPGDQSEVAMLFISAFLTIALVFHSLIVKRRFGVGANMQIKRARTVG